MDSDARSRPSQAVRARALLAAVFLSSFLLFQLEPMVAKAILPMFGGSASVWTAAMLFFQLLLLCGYALAHLLATRLGRFAAPLTQTVLGAAAVVAAWLWLLPSARGGSPDATMSELRVLAVLALHIGPPFLVLSASGPLLQSWSNGAHEGRDVFRLFAVSNAGSLVALLTYPFAVEPFLDLSTQGTVWCVLFTLQVGLLAFLGLGRRADDDTRQEEQEPGPGPGAETPTTVRKLLWFGLSACGCIMLLAATNRMAQDVPATPFLWVVPLSVYLITFVICFASDRMYSRRVWLIALPVAALFSLAASTLGSLRGALALILFHSATLFVCCMALHGELARMRPAGKHLTAYYLLVGAGGAAGGAFVSLLAPLVFNNLYELNIAWVLSYALGLAVLYHDRRSRFHRGRPTGPWVAMGIGGIAVIVLAVHAGLRHSRKVIYRERTFHGVMRVDESKLRDGATVRRLRHGGIIHGCQIFDDERRTMPTAYYGPTSGVGRAIKVLQTMGAGFDETIPLRIGAVGLGAGTIAAYGYKEDHFKFYELDAAVVRIAREYFTFLDDSPAQIETVVGDGRLALERELADGEPQQFDLLVVDAFSGDAVPLHLLTTEAVRLYHRHLKPGGVIAMHVSSYFLEFAPLVVGLADETGLLVAWMKEHQEPGGLVSSSDWLLLSSNAEVLAHPFIRNASRALPDPSACLVFTDERSSLVQLMGARIEPDEKD